MPIEAVKIPQNVYVDDHIVGPITLKQLFIMGIGTGIGYMCYALAIKAGVRNIVFLIACWTPTVITAAFAFLRINDLTLLHIILLSIEAMNKPSQRFWSPHPGLSINLITSQATKELAAANTKIIDNASRLADLTRQMEKRQEAMNHLAAHNDPNPNGLEPVRTQLEHVMDASPSLDAVLAPGRGEETPTGAVDPTRVQSDGLDPEKSIDSIAQDIASYERLTARAS